MLTHRIFIINSFSQFVNISLAPIFFAILSRVQAWFKFKRPHVIFGDIDGSAILRLEMTTRVRKR